MHMCTWIHVYGHHRPLPCELFDVCIHNISGISNFRVAFQVVSN